MGEQSDPSKPEPSEGRTHRVPTDKTYEWTRAIIDELPQFVLVKDATGRHILANEAVADSHGITVDQLEGTTDEEFVHEPDDRDYSMDDQSVLESGEPIEIPEDRIFDADGTERIVKSRLKRIEGPTGDDQLLVVATDITEEKRREYELEQQRDLLTKIERLGATGGWEIDPETDTVTWTAGTQHIFGVDDGDLSLDDALSYFHLEDRSAVERAIQRCLETDQPYDMECRINTTSGETRWVQIKGTPVVEGADRLLRGAINDITAQKHREVELTRQNDRLEEFAGVVAHDLRNPLTTAQGYTELAEETADMDHLSTVRAALDRMDAIVEDTLTLAREGQTVGELSSIDAAALTADCWQLVETADAAVDCVDQFRFQGDPDRVQHVFENLFRNSVEHGSTSSRTQSGDAVEHGSRRSQRDHADHNSEHDSPSSRAEPGDKIEQGRSSVTVSVGRLKDEAGFYIEDDGPGIPPAKRETVFEPGHSTRTDGTGFGLAIVKRIAEAHGWSVSLVDSQTGGARFEFTDVDIHD